jgi:hypothetical protein
MNNPEQFQKVKNEVTDEIVKRYGHPVSFWEKFQIKNIVGKVMAEADKNGEACLIYQAVAEMAEKMHEQCVVEFEDELECKQRSGRVLGICCHANALCG